jgi:Domain of unknown function DUF11
VCLPPLPLTRDRNRGRLAAELGDRDQDRSSHGHDAATNVSLTDGVPAGAVFQSLTAAAGWSCATPDVGAAGTVICNMPEMGNGATAQFFLSVVVACATPDGTMISNVATVVSDTRDPNPALNNTASIAVSVSNPPPSISDLAAHPRWLWPADHRMRFVTLTYGTSDRCDAGVVPVVTITSDQQEAERWHRHPESDWKVLAPQHVLLRAEVNPFSWAGRTYTITLTATDSVGSSSVASVDVRVPLWWGWWFGPGHVWTRPSAH